MHSFFDLPSFVIKMGVKSDKRGFQKGEACSTGQFQFLVVVWGRDDNVRSGC